MSLRATSLHCHRLASLVVRPPDALPRWLRRAQRLSTSRAMPSPPAASDQPAAAPPPAADRPHWDQVPQTPYTHVGIDKELYASAGGARFRQHVNPLKRELQVPAPPLDWGATFAAPALPLVLDIGCGYGRFLLALLKTMPGHNGIGLEIRDPVVERANRWAEGLGLRDRARFVLANATVSLDSLLAGCPAPVALVTVQFPDPHFKKRHRKRRVVQPRLVAAVAALMAPGGRLFLQSDVLEVAEDMRDQFERAAAFAVAPEHAVPGATFHEASEPAANDEGGEGEVEEEAEPAWESAWAAGGWLKDNPLPVPTERELHVMGQGLPVYRILLVKK